MSKPKLHTRRLFSISGYAGSVGLVLAASAACEVVRPYLSPTNMVMLYLLAVVIAALRFSIYPAIMTAFLGVLAFDLFFVPPRFSFSVHDKEYVLTFSALFIVGVVISSLVAKARERAESLRVREARTASLYHLSSDLAAAAHMQAVLQAAVVNIQAALDAGVAILISSDGKIEIAAETDALCLDHHELEVASWVESSGRMAGYGTNFFPSSRLIYLPLHALSQVVGVLGVRLTDSEPFSAEVRQFLEASATQVATAIERVRLSLQAEQAHILLARENLQRALLNSISHDFRTPLVSITGALGTLRDDDRRIGHEARRVLLDTAWEEAARLNRFVGNLLDMTRVEAGELHMKRELCDVQDLVGCALAAVEQRVGNREIRIRLPSELPLVAMDMVLMTQVLVNLLDNSLKYSPAGTGVDITVGMEADALTIEVADGGPGVPEEDQTKIFDKFFRIPVPEGATGTGLGLSIAKGIVEAHGGGIRAENRTGGGLRVVVTLPLKPCEEER